MRERSGRVRVGCVTWPKKRTGSVVAIESNVADAMAAIGSLSRARPDIICLPEGFLYAGMAFESAVAAAQATGDVVSAQFGRLAGDTGTYLAVPLLERFGDAVHNVVALLGRDGARIGTYKKQVLWPSNESCTQLENGLAPGDGGGPFQTDVGIVGIQVCMEIQWPGPWQSLRAAGARLVLFPSEYPGGMLLRHRAWQASCFIASAVSYGGPSQVIDPVGNVIAEWWPETPAGVIEIGLAFELVHLDYNAQKIKALLRELQGRIEITVHERERLCRVTSRDPAIDLGAVLRDYGISSLDEYLGRVGAANDAARLSRAASR